MPPWKGGGSTRLHSDPSHRFRVTVLNSHPGVSAVEIVFLAVAGSARSFFLGKREFYFVDGLDAVTPLAERVFGVEGGMYGSGLDPFFKKLRPELEVVVLKLLEGCAGAQFGRDIGFAVAHEPHTHTQVAPGHAEVGVLPVGPSPAVVFLEIGGAMLAEVVAALDDVVFEKVVAAARNASGLRALFGAAGLFYARDDPGVGAEPPDTRLAFGRADLRRRASGQCDADAADGGEHGAGGLGELLGDLAANQVDVVAEATVQAGLAREGGLQHADEFRRMPEHLPGIDLEFPERRFWVLEPVHLELPQQRLVLPFRDLNRRKTVFHQVERRLGKGRDGAAFFIQKSREELVDDLMDPVARRGAHAYLRVPVPGERAQGALPADLPARDGTALAEQHLRDAEQVELVRARLQVLPLLGGIRRIDAHDRKALFAQGVDEVVRERPAILAAEKDMPALDMVLAAALFNRVEQEGDAFGAVFDRERFFELLSRPVAKQTHVGLLRVVDRHAKHLVGMPRLAKEVDEGLILPGEYALVLHGFETSVCIRRTLHAGRHIQYYNGGLFFDPRAGIRELSGAELKLHSAPEYPAR